MNRNDLARVLVLRYLESTGGKSEIRDVISLLKGIWNIADVDFAADPQLPSLVDLVPSISIDEVRLFDGRVLMGRGHFDAAVASLSEGVDQFAPVTAFTERAAAHLKRGNIEDAILDCACALERDPNNPTAHVRMIHALWSARRIEDAHSAYRRALDCCPADEALRDLHVIIGSVDSTVRSNQ
jgi:tetratricopeptide (TPR) repeat protein